MEPIELRRVSFSSMRMIGRLWDCPRLRRDALAPHAETYQAGGQPAFSVHRS
jgi:hypothetical protein